MRFRNVFVFSIAIVLVVVAVSAQNRAFVPVTADMLRSPSPEDWLNLAIPGLINGNMGPVPVPITPNRMHSAIYTLALSARK
jgi:hypothetical protein